VLVLGLVPGFSHVIVIGLLAIVPFLAGSWFFSTTKRVIIDYV
jgi:hypothetical protein